MSKAAPVRASRKKAAYFLFSALALTAGILIYYFFRSGRLLIYDWFPFLPRNNGIIIFYAPSFPMAFFRDNLPHGLWFLSGLLFLRALWHEHPKTLLAYRICFMLMAILFEASQTHEGIAGTFCVLDLLTMGLVALLEGLAHKVWPKPGKSQNDNFCCNNVPYGIFK